MTTIKEELSLGHMTVECLDKCVQRGKMQEALLVCRDWELHELKDHLLREGSCQQANNPQQDNVHRVGKIPIELFINVIHDFRHLEKEFHRSTEASCSLFTFKLRHFLVIGILNLYWNDQCSN